MPLQSIISSKSNARLKVERYIDHTITQIETRTIGTDPLSANLVWTGDVKLSSVQRNPELWGYDLSDQLSGYYEWMTGYDQGLGGVAITRKHLLHCAHNGDTFMGRTFRFVNGDSSEYFETTSVDQYPLPHSPNGEFMTFEGNTYDLQIILLADELPPWVHIFSIIQFEEKYQPFITYGASRTSGKVCPLIAMSKGTNFPGPYQKMYVFNAWFYAVYDTILNSSLPYGLSDFNKRHPNPLLHAYFYDVSVGDSGTAVFTLINDALYLTGIMVGYNDEHLGITSSSHVRFINELIRRVDLSHGVSTGYTVNTQSFDSLKF